MNALPAQDGNAAGSEPELQEDLMSEMPEMTAEEQLAMLQLAETLMRKQERILSEQLYKLKIEEVSLRRIIDNQNRRGYNATQRLETPYTQKSQVVPTGGRQGNPAEGTASSVSLLPTKRSQKDFLNGPEMLGSQPPPPPLVLSQLPSQTQFQSTVPSHNYTGGGSTPQPSTNSKPQTLYDILYF